jgi:hypothetical protein
LSPLALFCPLQRTGTFLILLKSIKSRQKLGQPFSPGERASRLPSHLRVHPARPPSPTPAHHVRSPLLQPAAAAAAPAPFSDPRCLPPIPRPPSSRRHRVAVACPHPKRPLILKPPPSRPPVYHVCIAPGLPQPHIAPPTTPS